MSDSSEDQPASDRSGEQRTGGNDTEHGDTEQGGAEQFVALLGAHEPEVFRYIYALTGNWNDAQEVMQRVRIRIWQQFDQYDREKPFGAWARAIAYYLVLAYRKERSRQREFFSEKVLEAISATFSETLDSFDDRRDALLGCMKKLRNDQRQLVNDYYSRNEPVAELADGMGLSPGALRQSLFRIRKILQRCVERSMRQSY